VNFKEQYWDFLGYRNEFNPRLPVLRVTDTDKERSKNPTVKIIADKLDKNAAILDIGAGDKRLKTVLEVFFQSTLENYFSLDIDKKYPHDYYDLKDVDRKFDAVFLMEFLEHLPFEAGIDILETCYKSLNEGGWIFLSTPNVEHINQLWRSDVTHVQQWPARDLYSIMRLLGFHSIEGYNIYINSGKQNIKRKIRLALKKILCNILEVNYAHGIFFMGQKTS
jgi:hypothetical protein